MHAQKYEYIFWRCFIKERIKVEYAHPTKMKANGFYQGSRGVKFGVLGECTSWVANETTMWHWIRKPHE